MRGPPVPPPVTDPRVGQQIQQGFQQLDRPETGPGDLAATILKAPLTVPLGIAEELRGLMGGDTIQGWAQEARSRYNSPTFSETRAFGVQGNAEEPSFGDRFLGVVTGSAQRGALAGKEIRQQIGAYNAQRKAALRENKDVQQLQQGQLGIEGGFIQNERNSRKNEIERKYSELQTLLGIAGQRSNLATQAVSRANMGQEMSLRDIAISIKTMEEAKARGEQVDEQMLSQLYADHPELRGLSGAADILTRGSVLTPNAIKSLREATGEGARNQTTILGNVEKAATQPSFGTGLTPEQQQRIDDAMAARDIAEQARKDTAAALQAFRDQGEADKKAIRDREEINATLSDIDHAYAKRKEVEIQEPSGFFAKFGKGPIVPSVPDQIKALNDESMLLKSDVAAGKYLGKRGDALLRAQGLSAAPTVDVAPQVAPLATPTPGLDARIGTMSSADKLAERLAREVQDTGIRPTPMATPKPAGEDARRENADKLMRFRTQFNADWQRLHPSKPIGGEVYKREFNRNAIANNLTVESID